MKKDWKRTEVVEADIAFQKLFVHRMEQVLGKYPDCSAKAAVMAAYDMAQADFLTDDEAAADEAQHIVDIML